MVIYGGIDGSGVLNCSDYAADYDRSFTHRIYDTWSGGGAHYIRGPGNPGLATGFLADYIAARVVAQYPFSKGVILAGHSRGGAAAIHACYLLEKLGINVDYLFLFDAVNMYLTVWTHVIPSNVKFVYHARRDPKTKSRPSWGNCGCHHNSETTYFERFFFATHSGVGGVPWYPWELEHGRTVALDQKIVESGVMGFAENHTDVEMLEDVDGSFLVGRWMLPMVIVARRLLESTGKPSVIVPGTDPAMPPHYGQHPNGDSQYTVGPGDSLSVIAGRQWGDVLLWPILYKPNVKTIGPDHNLIKPGQHLIVPNIKNFSPQELATARQQGKNWR